MSSDDGLINKLNNDIVNEEFLLILNSIDEKTNESLLRLKNRNSFFEDIISYMDKFKNENLSNFTENDENICPNSKNSFSKDKKNKNKKAHKIHIKNDNDDKKKLLKSKSIENILCPYLKIQLESYDKFHEKLLKDLTAKNEEESQIFQFYSTTFNVNDKIYDLKNMNYLKSNEVDYLKRTNDKDFQSKQKNASNNKLIIENDYYNNSKDNCNNTLSTNENTLAFFSSIDINKTENDFVKGNDITFSENVKFSYNQNQNNKQSRSNSVQHTKSNSQFAASYKSPSPQNIYKSKWK